MAKHDDLAIEYRGVNKLTPAAKNARTHTRKQIRQIAKSIPTAVSASKSGTVPSNAARRPGRTLRRGTGNGKRGPSRFGLAGRISPNLWSRSTLPAAPTVS